MRLACTAMTVALLLSFVPRAIAQIESHNVVDTQLFEPAIGPDTFLSVEGAGVADHLGFGLGMMMSYQNRKTQLYLSTTTKVGGVTGGFDLGDEQTIDLDPADNQLTADLLGFVGFHIRWLHTQVGYALPINILVRGAVDEISDTGQVATELSASGIGDLRLQLKAMLLRDLNGFSLALSPIVTLPTGTDDCYDSDNSLTVRPRIAAGYRRGAFNAAINLGWLFREDRTLYGMELADQLLYGAGASYRVTARLALVVELFGRAGPFSPSRTETCRWDPDTGTTVCDTGETSEDSFAYPMEIDLGARVGLNHGLSLTGGAGLGLIEGLGSPRFRLVAGILWAPVMGKEDEALKAP